MKGDKKMKVTFENVLVCDVDCITYENKHYYGLIVYQNGQLYRISLPNGSQSEFSKQIGQKITVDASMRVFDGKTKFKLN